MTTPEESFEAYKASLPEHLTALKDAILKEQLEGHDEHEEKLTALFHRLEQEANSTLTVTEEVWE